MLNETISKTRLRDGSEITFFYVEGDQILKPGCHCDAVRAYIDGQQVGYVKFDYTSKEILARECPTLWSFAYHYTGFSCGSVNVPYGEQTIGQLFSLVNSVHTYLRYVDLNALGLTPRQKEIYNDSGSLRHRELKDSITDLDRVPMITLLKKLEKSKAAKAQYGSVRTKYLRHHSKPFVAYSNTGESLYTRNGDDRLPVSNLGRGIGSLLYRATSAWIAERGLAKGLYASGNRSDSALALWKVFEQRGWTTKDQGRLYLDPAKFPPL